MNRHINTHGQVIGVRHFLDTRLKPKQEQYRDTGKHDCYPLYVQITVKQQTTTIKSSITERVPKQYFDSFIADHSIQVLIEEETLRITEQILADNPFGKGDFKLTEAMDRPKMISGYSTLSGYVVALRKLDRTSNKWDGLSEAEQEKILQLSGDICNTVSELKRINPARWGK